MINRKQIHRKALALIVVVYLMAALNIIVWALALRSKVAIKNADLILDRMQEQQIACAVALEACKVLALDDPNIDHLGELWAQPGTYASDDSRNEDADNFPAEWQASWTIVDESGKVNLNTAGPDLIKAVGNLDDAAVNSVLDWRDNDDVPNPDGAESDYYQSLQIPYSCKNNAFDSVDELCLVKGFNASVVCGINDSNNSNSSYNAEKSQALPGRPEDFFTVYGDGKINFNTVSEQAINAVPLLSESAKAEILRKRQTVGACFQSITDIEADENFTLTDKLVLKQIAKFNSQYFQIYLKIKKNKYSYWCPYSIIVNRQIGNIQIVKWQRKIRYISDQQCAALATKLSK